MTQVIARTMVIRMLESLRYSAIVCETLGEQADNPAGSAFAKGVRSLIAEVEAVDKSLSSCDAEPANV